MTPACMEFCERFGKDLEGEILEVGSYYVNGTVRDVMPVTYGVDMRNGPCVDEVCRAEDLVARFGQGSYAHVVSCEMLEHAEDWKEALVNMWDVIIPGGFLILTTRSPGFPLHDYPSDYWRFTVDHMEAAFPTGVVESLPCTGVAVAAMKANNDPLELDHVTADGVT